MGIFTIFSMDWFVGENLNRKPWGFYHQIDRAFRLKFSHHPILWYLDGDLHGCHLFQPFWGWLSCGETTKYLGYRKSPKEQVPCIANSWWMDVHSQHNPIGIHWYWIIHISLIIGGCWWIMYILITVDNRTAFSSHFCWWNLSSWLTSCGYSHVISLGEVPQKKSNLHVCSVCHQIEAVVNRDVQFMVDDTPPNPLIMTNHPSSIDSIPPSHLYLMFQRR